MTLTHKGKSYNLQHREETDKAIRVRQGAGYGFWYPKSCVTEGEISEWGWKMIFRFQNLKENGK